MLRRQDNCPRTFIHLSQEFSPMLLVLFAYSQPILVYLCGPMFMNRSNGIRHYLLPKYKPERNYVKLNIII